jgi:hypothetical protein
LIYVDCRICRGKSEKWRTQASTYGEDLSPRSLPYDPALGDYAAPSGVPEDPSTSSNFHSLSLILTARSNNDKPVVIFYLHIFHLNLAALMTIEPLERASNNVFLFSQVNVPTEPLLITDYFEKITIEYLVPRTPRKSIKVYLITYLLLFLLQLHPG